MQKMIMACYPCIELLIEVTSLCQELLIDAKADVNMEDNSGELHWAAEKGRIEVVELSIKMGAKVNVKNNYGLISFDWVSYRGNADMP